MATFIGTSGPDTIDGTSGDLTGNDTIIGNAGNDTLSGDTGNDLIQGGDDNDVLNGEAGADSLEGGAGSDVLNGGTGGDTLAGGAGSDVYFVDGQGDVVQNASIADGDLVLASAAYRLDAGSAISTLGYAAAPTTAVPVVAINTTAAVDVNFAGNEFENFIYGTGGANVLDGGRNTNPTLGDHLGGYLGDDTYIIRNPNDSIFNETGGNDIVYVSAGDLTAQGQAVASFNLGTNSPTAAIETLSAADQLGTDNLILTGNSASQQVVGNFGANTLAGGSGGTDTLIGLAGDDTYVIRATTDVIQETTGNDTVTFASGNALAGTFTLGADVSIETIRLSNTVVSVTGNNLNQTIIGDTTTGNTTAETLNGGTGTDTLVGGNGADTYVVNDATDVITETGFAADGTTTTTDIALFSGTTGGYDLANTGTSIDVLATATAAGVADLTGTSGVYLVGNAGSQAIYGNAGANILDGDRGTGTNADTLYGGAGDDIYRVYGTSDVFSENIVTAGAGNTFVVTANSDAGGNDTVYTSVSLTLGVAATIGSFETLSAADQAGTTAINLTGNATAQRLIGNAGDNTLSSGTINGAGADTLIGLGGNDTYVLTNATDVVREAVGGGTDAITFGGGFTATSYTLTTGSEVESITLSGAVTSVTGNLLAQTITGTAVAETLIGGGGADTLVGGGGIDAYNVASVSAVITDNDGLANTLVYSGTTNGYDLADGVSITTASLGGATSTTVGTGTENLYLVGNNLAQALYGNAGDNILNGQGGVGAGGVGDTLVGGAGNDTYRVFTSNINANGAIIAGGDVVTENANEGNDVIYTSANYALGANVESLVAASQADVTTLTLVGNTTANVISGGNGNNVIAGGDGIDTLTGLGGADTFHFASTLGAANADTIADFSEAQGDRISLDLGIFNGLGGTVDASEFQLGTVATGSSATILFDQATGRLFYDADGGGAGAAVIFAQLNPGTTLAATDFVLTPAGTLPTP